MKRLIMKKWKNFEDRFFTGLIIAVLVFICFSMFYPFWNAVVIAFNESRDTTAGGLTFWPRKFTLENVSYVLQDPRIGNAFFISVLRTGIGTFVAVLINALFAFSLSRPELKLRKVYLALSIFALYFSGGMIPTYILIRDIGLRNNFWVYIFPGALSVWNMIIFRSFFASLPAGLIESARIDGAGWYLIFFRIIIPISLPVFATLSLFTAVGHWNSWFDAALYISRQELSPIQTILNTILNSNSMQELMSKLPGPAATALSHLVISSRTVSMTTMVVATMPILLVYPFIQRYFVHGVMIGSLKG
ncbi:MAG: carbohydrate ABC transporter permease [Treponema sp.]|jgi:putative aldouronate transport system permease protein|nr:carbohydrate ABC transporter permease [Treponema sp.]